MKTVEIKKGLVVVAKGKVGRVERILEEGRLVVSMQADRSQQTVFLHEVELLPDVSGDKAPDVEGGLRSKIESCSPEDIQIAKHRFDMISDVLAGVIDIESAINDLGISKSHFYRLRKRYCAQIGFMSVMQEKRGVKDGSARLSGEVEDLIQRSIDSKYKGRSASAGVVWREVEKECIKQHLPIPSRSVVSSRLKQRDPRDLLSKKEGREAASQKHDAKPGKKEVSRPLEITQMDHTLVDVILVDEKDRKPLGRPWLTIIIDLYTRVILGYYLSFHAPSALSISCALSHAALPKFDFLSRLGMSGDRYPHYGVPQVIGVDNAKEFKSPKFEKACDIYGVDVKWRPLGKKHFGGHVERLLGTLMIGAVQLLPGTTYSNVVKRRGQNSDKAAVVTFKEFSLWFARQVCIYHARNHSSLGMSPAAKWNEYYYIESGAQSRPPLVVNPMQFRLDFMPECYRCINREGIKLNGYLYWNSSLSHCVGRGNFKVKYDPFSLKQIWVFIDGEYVSVPFSNVALPDRSLLEHKALIKYRKLVGGAVAGQLEDHSVVGMIDECDQIIKESLAKTKKAHKALAAKQEYFDGHYGCGEGESSVGVDIKPNADVDYSVRAKLFRGASYD